MFHPGNKIFDIEIKKYGKIVNLRNDIKEREIKDQEASHYYYNVDYDDGSFDICVNGNSLILHTQCLQPQIETKTEIKTETKLYTYSNYKQGQRFVNTYTNQIGTIRYLRDDEYEKNQRKSDPTHYCYFVDYDDGSFETYECGEYLKPI